MLKQWSFWVVNFSSIKMSNVKSFGLCQNCVFLTFLYENMKKNGMPDSQINKLL